MRASNKPIFRKTVSLYYFYIAQDSHRYLHSGSSLVTKRISSSINEYQLLPWAIATVVPVPLISMYLLILLINSSPITLVLRT